MKILVTVPFTDDQRSRLQAQMPAAEFLFLDKKEVTKELLRKIDILMGNVSPKLLRESTEGEASFSLKWVQLNSAGSDAYAAPGVVPQQVQLTNATGAYGLALSEHMLAQTFFLKKKIGRYVRNQQQSLWRDEGEVTAIAGSRTLVLGLGNIGGDYARKMAALGSRVIGIKRTQAVCLDYLEAIGTFEEIDRYLPEADIVAMALPNTPQTVHIINRERLAAMKKGSILLNVGRGSAIDQEALLEALANGPLAGAAIDVTDPEPLPADHPLWKCENLLLTPHIAGDYHLKETLENIVELFIDNLGRYARGEELRNPVDRATGYRKS